MPENKSKIICFRSSTETKGFCISENNDGSPKNYSKTISFGVVISLPEIIYFPV
jgi:hypothetical protein